MIIVPAYCAQSFSSNNKAENAVAEYISRVTNLGVIDFSTKARPEYDFQLFGSHGSVQVELKTTADKYIPVEMYKDRERTIPSGLNASTAPFVVTLSLGKRTGYKGDVGKLRVFKRTTLMTAAVREGRGHFFEGPSKTQCAYVYSVPPQNISHAWLGDIPVEYIRVTNDEKPEFLVGYNLDAIFDDNGNGAAQFVDWINDKLGVSDE